MGWGKGKGYWHHHHHPHGIGRAVAEVAVVGGAAIAGAAVATAVTANRAPPPRREVVVVPAVTPVAAAPVATASPVVGTVATAPVVVVKGKGKGKGWKGKGKGKTEVIEVPLLECRQLAFRHLLSLSRGCDLLRCGCGARDRGFLPSAEAIQRLRPVEGQVTEVEDERIPVISPFWLPPPKLVNLVHQCCAPTSLNDTMPKARSAPEMQTPKNRLLGLVQIKSLPGQPQLYDARVQSYL